MGLLTSNDQILQNKTIPHYHLLSSNLVIEMSIFFKISIIQFHKWFYFVLHAMLILHETFWEYNRIEFITFNQSIIYTIPSNHIKWAPSMDVVQRMTSFYLVIIFGCIVDTPRHSLSIADTWWREVEHMNKDPILPITNK